MPPVSGATSASGICCGCFAGLSIMRPCSCTSTVKQTSKTAQDACPSDHLHGFQLEGRTALMLKEGCQPRGGAGAQVSWVWHSGCLQAGVCAGLSHPALPTQLSFHFAAQHQNGSCIFLTASQAHSAHQPQLDQP